MTSAPDSDARGARRLPLVEAEFGNYDVFISHRGPDTKSVFVGCLDGALKRAGFQPFLDCKCIDVGQHSWECIEHAIQRTPLAVVVFSKGFAGSEWCLRELHAMLACRSVKVIPVFYDVEPWELKYLENGRLAEGFAKLKKRHNKTLIKEWRADLKVASAISGELCGVGSKRLVEDVVAEVVEKICEFANKLVPLHVGDHVFGHKEVAGNLIRTVYEKKVSVLGLWGMGGIGKSTLAREVFNQLQGRFDASCFVGDVTEKVDKNGVTSVQSAILKALCGNQSIDNFLDQSEGKGILEARLSHKRILVVLDDVCDDDQMRYLMSHKMLKEGSLCIVTSRDRGVFENSISFSDDCKVHIHGVQTLTDQDSRAVLASHAFGRDREVPPEFRVLFGAIRKACGGVPLVLGVIGSRLRTKNMGIWNEISDMLAGGSIMDERNVLKVLRSNYDTLRKSHKEMFLDIACALLGSSVEKATFAWRSQGWRPALGVWTLIERALITVDDKGIIHMHDVLRDMGREISKRDSKGKRVWDSEYSAMLNAREALPDTLETLDIQWRLGREVDLSSMERLRILKVNDKGGDSPIPSSSFPTNLHLLEVRGTLIKNLPPFFGKSKMLRVLDLGSSLQLEDLPDSFQGLENLEYLHLEFCSFKKLPEFFGDLRKLEVLILRYCKMLRVLPISFGDLENLKQLDLYESAIESLPDSFRRLHNLKCVSLYGTKIQNIPEYIGTLSNLEELVLGYKIRSVPESIGRLYKLKCLNLGYTSIQSIPESIGTLSNLETLNIGGCRQLMILPQSLGGLQNLRVLDLGGTEIQSLLESIGTLSNLIYLNLRDCKDFVKLPDSFGGLRNLRDLNLGSTGIQRLPESIGTLIYLEILDVSRCSQLVQLPNCFGGLKNLRKLDFSFIGIQSLPESIGLLSNLEKLHLYVCKGLVELPDCFRGLQNLRHLSLSQTSIQSLPPFVGTLGNLETLEVSGCPHLLELPDFFGGLRNLRHLDLPATKIRSLPESIGTLSNLVNINLCWCDELVELPNSILNLPVEIQRKLRDKVQKNLSRASMKALRIGAVL